MLALRACFSCPLGAALEFCRIAAADPRARFRQRCGERDGPSCHWVWWLAISGDLGSAAPRFRVVRRDRGLADERDGAARKPFSDAHIDTGGGGGLRELRLGRRRDLRGVRGRDRLVAPDPGARQTTLALPGERRLCGCAGARACRTDAARSARGDDAVGGPIAGRAASLLGARQPGSGKPAALARPASLLAPPNCGGIFGGLFRRGYFFCG